MDLPVAIVADRRPDARMEEVRVYYSNWPLTGRHASRPPVLQPDPELRQPDVVGDYQRALAAGDLDAIVASFEPGAYAREPAGTDYVHRGPEGLREFYEWLFSNEGGIPLEHCSVTDDGRSCALEYNVVRWSRTDLLPGPESPSMSWARAASSPPPASTTTPSRRSPHLPRRRTAARRRRRTSRR